MNGPDTRELLSVADARAVGAFLARCDESMALPQEAWWTLMDLCPHPDGFRGAATGMGPSCPVCGALEDAR